MIARPAQAVHAEIVEKYNRMIALVMLDEAKPMSVREAEARPLMAERAELQRQAEVSTLQQPPEMGRPHDSEVVVPHGCTESAWRRFKKMDWAGDAIAAHGGSCLDCFAEPGKYWENVLCWPCVLSRALEEAGEYECELNFCMLFGFISWQGEIVSRWFIARQFDRVNRRWGGNPGVWWPFCAAYLCLPCFACQFVRAVRKLKSEDPEKVQSRFPKTKNGEVKVAVESPSGMSRREGERSGEDDVNNNNYPRMVMI